MRIAVAFVVGIALCIALLMQMGRINRYGWDISPFPHSKTSLQLRKDRLALYSLYLVPFHGRIEVFKNGHFTQHFSVSPRINLIPQFYREGVLDATRQRQAGNLPAADKDYQTIISGPITLRNGNDYVVKAYVAKARVSLREVRKLETGIGQGSDTQGVAKAKEEHPSSP